MQKVSLKLLNEIQGAEFAYVQSDEISILITDLKKMESQGWFGYNVQKMVSVSAAICSIEFSKLANSLIDNEINAVFDSRVFNLSKINIEDYFIWRQNDCYRNAINSYATQIFSRKRIQGKNINEVKQMFLDNNIGNFEELVDLKFYYGTYITKEEKLNINFKDNREKIRFNK